MLKFCSFQSASSKVSSLFLSIKSYILDSNGVWYSSFWSEWAINPQNLRSGFCPQGFRMTVHMAPRRHLRYHVRRHSKPLGTKFVMTIIIICVQCGYHHSCTMRSSPQWRSSLFLYDTIILMMTIIIIHVRCDHHHDDVTFAWFTRPECRWHEGGSQTGPRKLLVLYNYMDYSILNICFVQHFQRKLSTIQI